MKKDLAWAAGFYDGEGSVSCVANNGNPHTLLQLSIGQKDYNGHIADTLIKFLNIVKCGHIYRKTKTGKEINQHQFFVSKLNDTKKVIDMLWEFLSKSKQEQATKALILLKEGREKIGK